MKGPLGLVASLIALNVLVTAYLWIPAGRPLLALVPAVETGAIFLLIAVGGRLRGVRIAGISVVSLAVIYAAAETLYQYFYGRHFAPWSDIPFIQGGLYLLFGAVDAWIVPLTVVALLAILAAGWGLGWLVVRGMRYAAEVRPRPLLIGVAAALLVAGALARPAGNWLVAIASSSVSRPVAGEELQAAVAAEQAPVAGLPNLAGHDIHLFFVESYGESAYSRPELAADIVPRILEHERRLVERGYGVASGFLESPVVGGYSWIAEAALLTGAPIANQTDYESAIEQKIETLPGILSDNGYFTLLSMPGTVHGEWPEAKEFYRFGEVMLAPDFDYVGPTFSFVPVPDQLAIQQAYAYLTDARPPSEPAYVQHVLVSSHAPYNRIPPFIEDWSTLGDGSIYNRLPIRLFDNDWFSGNEFDEGYVTALSYTLDSVFTFLSTIVQGECLAIVVGDHQPGRPVRPADAGRNVAIHIVASNRAVTDAFVENGYARSLVPGGSGEPMHAFLDRFLAIATLPTEREREPTP